MREVLPSSSCSLAYPLVSLLFCWSFPAACRVLPGTVFSPQQSFYKRMRHFLSHLSTCSFYETLFPKITATVRCLMQNLNPLCVQGANSQGTTSLFSFSPPQSKKECFRSVLFFHDFYCIHLLYCKVKLFFKGCLLLNVFLVNIYYHHEQKNQYDVP